MVPSASPSLVKLAVAILLGLLGAVGVIALMHP